MKMLKLTGLNDEPVLVNSANIQIVGEAFQHSPSSIDPSKTVTTKVGTMIALIGQQVVVREDVEDVVKMVEAA